jgi:acetyltransferase-like isoleucine patch superfamily enzyme
MIKIIKNYINKKKLRKKYNFGLHRIEQFSKKSQLLIEEFSSIGKARVLSENCSIGAHSYIRSGCIDNVESIGRYCSFGLNVYLGQDPKKHPLFWAATHNGLTGYNNVSKGLIIGNDVWIGDGVTVMSGLTIGNGAVIGTGAIVTKDVEPYQIVVGVPSRLIKYRFEGEVQKALLKSEWWNKSHKSLKKLDFSNVELFLNEVNKAPVEVEYNKVFIKHRALETL